MEPNGRPANLREACIEEAFAIVATTGVEKLSLREVARRLGVSHQAPYKHFPSRDHLLAELVARAFREFAARLEARPASAEPFDDLHAMGDAYLDFAREQPMKYRLMFDIALPDPEAHPDMLAEARHAFALLHDRLGSMALRDPRHPAADPARHDAIFVWSTLHGLVSLMSSDAMRTLDMTAASRSVATERVRRRLDLALVPDRDDADG